VVYLGAGALNPVREPLLDVGAIVREHAAQVAQPRLRRVRVAMRDRRTPVQVEHSRALALDPAGV